MTPVGHCFFCDDLTDRSVGKIVICEFCMDELYHVIYHAHETLKKEGFCQVEAEQ